MSRPTTADKREAFRKLHEAGCFVIPNPWNVSGSLARVAMHAFIRTATEIAKEGKFDGFAGLITNPELNKFFSEDREKLSS
jgi:hypothetical protein